MFTAENPTDPADQNNTTPHLDEHLDDRDVPEFEEEVELWTTYGGD